MPHQCPINASSLSYHFTENASSISYQGLINTSSIYKKCLINDLSRPHQYLIKAFQCLVNTSSMSHQSFIMSYLSTMPHHYLYKASSMLNQSFINVLSIPHQCPIKASPMSHRNFIMSDLSTKSYQWPILFNLMIIKPFQEFGRSRSRRLFVGQSRFRFR